MSKNRLYFLLVVPLLLLFTFVVVKKSVQQNQRNNNVQGVENVHGVEFFNEKSFYSSILKLESQRRDYQVRGGVIPHHLLAGYLIGGFFKTIAYQNPEVIVLITPNHHDAGDSEIATTDYSWSSEFGYLEPERKTIEKVVQENYLSYQHNIFPDEHAISGIVPYIKYFLPNARVIPLILKSTTRQENVDDLANVLALYVNEKTIVVAAVDFSHYLKASDAKKNDEYTLELIRNFNYNSLFMLSDDHIDSPASVTLTLKLMELLGATNIEVVQHTNSSEILNDPFVATTSYYSLLFY